MNQVPHSLWRRGRPGQTIVIVALAMLTLIALVGLAVDGGSALLQRRNMQNAADAGALAAAQMMQANMAVSCGDNNGAPIACHPTYTVFNGALLARVSELLVPNRGGALGPAVYSKRVEYHIPDPSGGSGYVPADAYAAQDLVPSGADGVRVTATMNNPTTFAHAINIAFIPVSAQAATRLYPTSAPPVTPGPSTLPITRYRPDVEDKMQHWSNELCNPFPFWDNTDPRFAGPIITLRDHSQYRLPGQPALFQPLSGLDYRSGTSGGLGNYDRNGTPQPHKDCPPSCADMLQGGQGTGVDLANWTFWQWSGLISRQTWWPQDPITPTLGTAFPSNRNNPNGAGGIARQGDWAETYPGRQDDLQDIAHDLLYAPSAFTTLITPPLPDGLNWGKAVDLNLYLWGPPLSPTPDTLAHAQMWMSGVQYPSGCGLFPNPPCQTYTGWEDLKITGLSAVPSIQFSCLGGCPAPEIDRVRFTRAVRFRIFANLEGRGETYFPAPGTQPFAPSRCTIAFMPMGFDGTVWGLFMQQPVDAPQPGGVTAWTMAGGVYLRVIDP